jgi:hypothetical protein
MLLLKRTLLLYKEVNFRHLITVVLVQLLLLLPVYMFYIVYNFCMLVC